ncbi:MAG: fluoride efflux transporter CrcB [Betaproteobacteria bacterium]|jgi:CrcB protein
MYDVFAICLGACIGALMRWQVGLWLNPMLAIPLGTLMVNWLGAYLIGLLIGLFQALPHLEPIWRNMLITGFLGALTTFSTFSAEVMGFLVTQQFLKALLLSGLHLLGSLFLTFLGIKTASLLLPH